MSWWITQEAIKKMHEDLRGYDLVNTTWLRRDCGVFMDTMKNDRGDVRFVVRNYRLSGYFEIYTLGFSALTRLSWLSSDEAIWADMEMWDARKSVSPNLSA